jgi:hypothetical protein
MQGKSADTQKGGIKHYYRYMTKWHSNAKLSKEPVTIVLSPHMDDAFLSLSSIISNGSLGRNILAINVFTTTDSTIKTSANTDFSTVAKVSNLRMSEELTFADYLLINKINYIPIFLGMKDAAIDAYYGNIAANSIKALPPIIKDYAKSMNNKHANRRMKDIKIDTILDGLLSQFENNVKAIVAPIGIGDHLDHVVLRTYAESLGQKTKVGLYADIPYIYYYNCLSMESLRSMLPKGFRSHDQEFFDPVKKERLFREIYKSQKDPTILKALKAISTSVGEIIFWSR